MELVNKIIDINPNYLIIVLLTVFFTLEQILSNPFVFKNRTTHLFQNILFQLALTLLNLFFLTLQVSGIEWLNAHEVGLLYLIQLPFWVKLIISVMLYDFTTYWVHRASHKFPILWRLHRVHHSDNTMDSTTTFRFHPVEIILIYQTGNLLTAALFGTDTMAMALYYTILYLFFFLEHANLHYPRWLNNTLGLVLVMPDHHRVHHHQEQHYTDSNFADIFILWDRIFGTFQLIPLSQMKYGLKEFASKERQSFWYLMKSPFKKISSDSSLQQD